MGDFKDNTFTGVSAYGSNVYAVTRKGVLCVVGASRRLDKWVALRTTAASSVAVCQSYVACCCAEGVIRHVLVCHSV